MTAVPQPTRTDQPATIDPERYVSLRDAAQLLNKNRDHLGRLCGKQLHRQGLAVYGAGPDGGNPGWWIAHRYDLRLARGAAGERQRIPADELERFSQKHVDAAFGRAACVDAYRRARQQWRGDQRDWLPALAERLNDEYPGLKVSVRSLQRWYKLYKAPADVAKLIDKRGGNTRGQADPAAWAFFRDIFLDDREPTMKTCWQRTKEEAQARGWTWISYEAVKRQVNDRIPRAFPTAS